MVFSQWYGRSYKSLKNGQALSRTTSRLVTYSGMVPPPVPGELRVVTRTVILRVTGDGIQLPDIQQRLPEFSFVVPYKKVTRSSGPAPEQERAPLHKRPKKPFKNHLALLLSVPDQETPMNCKVFETNRIQITGVKTEASIESAKRLFGILLNKEADTWHHEIPLTNAFFYLSDPVTPAERGHVDMVPFSAFLQRNKAAFGADAIVTLDPMLIKSIKVVRPEMVTILINSTGNVWLLGARSIDHVHASEQLVKHLYTEFSNERRRISKANVNSENIVAAHIQSVSDM